MELQIIAQGRWFTALLATDDGTVYHTTSSVHAIAAPVPEPMVAALRGLRDEIDALIGEEASDG